jgi:16S rRNA (cytidine1402-2'-O)-methyltransferase
MTKEDNKGTIYLIPTIIAENTQFQVIPPQVVEIIEHTRYFLTENIRTSRRYFSSLKISRPIESFQFECLNKDTPPETIPSLMQPALNGENIGVLSEAGCPGIADPGALAVKFAHEHHLKVVPLTGPSSIFLALMASGFSGQSFTFHGYLPIETKERAMMIKTMEKAASTKKQTQIFMETPYRNQKLFDQLLQTCQPSTQLCIAKNISGENEFIQTMPVYQWRKNKPELNKEPVIFLLFTS